MDWKKRTIPAVLLLSLAVPPAQSQAGGRGGLQGPSASQAERTPRVPAPATSQSRTRRRNEADGISPATLAGACEYLRHRANGQQPDAQVAQAWETFYQWGDGHIRRFAGAMGLRGANVDDCAQEVWADLMIRLPDFRMDASRGRFTSWLYTIVRSKAADQMRRQGRKGATSLSPEVSADLPGREPDPAVLLEQHGDRELVRAGLARLRQGVSDLSYRVLHLRYFDGLAPKEVADSLGITPDQVWVREHRAKRKLGEILRSAGRRLGIAANPRPLTSQTA